MRGCILGGIALPLTMYVVRPRQALNLYILEPGMADYVADSGFNGHNAAMGVSQSTML
jgi:hypothetical protein